MYPVHIHCTKRGEVLLQPKVEEMCHMYDAKKLKSVLLETFHWGAGNVNDILDTFP